MLLYLLFGTIHCFSPSGTGVQLGVRPELLALVSIASLALGLAAWRDIVLLFASFRVRRVNIFSDPYFFANHFPTDTPILAGYQLPARPPAVNMLAAFFLAQTGRPLRDIPGGFRLSESVDIPAVLPNHARAGRAAENLRSSAAKLHWL